MFPRAKGLSFLLLVVALTAGAAQSPQVILPGTAILQFAQPLSTLSIAPQNGTMTTVLGSRPLTLRMCEFKAYVLPPGTVSGYGGTWVWGYLVDDASIPTAGGNRCSELVNYYGGVNKVVDTYIGPVIVNRRGAATQVRYINDLGSAATTNVLAYKYSTDQTLHWADPLAPWGMANQCMMMNSMGGPAYGSPCAQNYAGPVAAVPHLHGAEVPAEIDGSPDSWFTSDGLYRGHKYYSFGAGAGNEATYVYPNTQEAAPLWFHDHTLGATRLNVYAGLAGAYFIYDPALNLPANLHPLNEVVPLVLQDRMFDTQGQLFFQAGSNGGVLWALNADHPYWSPEFVGDSIVINGKAWPFFNVEPKRYRFLVLNGSNARTYELFLTNNVTKVNGPALYVIGTDGGYLDGPVKIDPNAPKGQQQRLVILPGERYEVIVDFAGLSAGTTLRLKNIAKTPYPAGDTPTGGLGQLMEFRVGPCTSGACGPSDFSYNPAANTPLRGAGQQIVRLANAGSGTLATGILAAKTRELTLNEVMGMGMETVDPATGEETEYEGGPLEILVNNTKWSGKSDRSYADFTARTTNGVTTLFTEMPAEGATEVWEIVNLTADAHPIHLHLVQFQIINRQSFATDKYDEAYEEAFPSGEFQPGFGPPKDYRAANNPLSGGKDGGNPDITPYLKGPVRLPLASEAGWKDTIMVPPGQVTRLVVRWAPTDAAAGSTGFFPFDPSGEGLYNYVWHCHIIDHEDNEMMRPDTVAPSATAVRSLIKGLNY